MWSLAVSFCGFCFASLHQFVFWLCELLELVTYKSTVWGARVVHTENCYHWGSGLGARGPESGARQVGQRAHDEHTIHKHRGQSIVTEKPLPRVSQQQDVMSKMFPCEAVYLILAFSVLVSETSAVCSHLQLPFHPSCLASTETPCLREHRELF